ncbi:hypothetical protein PQJ75_22755 [Rhodoplanes sp. TEM]|uniref:Uncharacterized protein n=1 Tax=Rhodoplanes tepidamans TaxID=200616 RepID=A0ABT5JI65_RHOTP|nr:MULTISPECIES: hypothetical protein [Rhodoplanes]MDC7789296.1 hypothetical protein [Rhodoplanes tepidamans]MDC7986558.1 hypothetical protein [Rhodoplanes sp. TEM]MDQ0359086.1 antibiotic biosynthesis monooxygenase (ABM) superfamily enzyme [Rhodoplanes tepidamans]
MPSLPSVPVRLAHLRFVVAAMAGAYLVINAILALVAPLTAGWSFPALTAVVVPPMVLAMIHLVIPLARRVG